MSTNAADKSDQLVKPHRLDDIAHNLQPAEAPHNRLFIGPGHDDHRQCCESGIPSQFTQYRQARISGQVKIEHDEIRKNVGLPSGWLPKTFQCAFRRERHVINARSWRLWLSSVLLPGEVRGLAKQLCFTRTIFKKKDSLRFPRSRNWLRCKHVVQLRFAHRTLCLARERGNRLEGIKTSQESCDKMAHS